MKNTLGKNIKNWEKIGAPDHVIEWISDGVKFPITEDINDISFEIENKWLSPKDNEFLHAEISDLLLLGCIEKCDIRPKCISPIKCVPKKNGKARLVTDLRFLNSKSTAPKFKSEDITSVVSLIKPKDFIITTDLKSGFFHIPVHTDHQELLGFKFQNTYFKWTVLPFGHCCSPYFFAKTIRPIIAYLRTLGLKVVVYVDDFILVANETQIYNHKHILLQTLQDLGWVINYEKSSLEPTQVKKYLGHIIDCSGEKCIIRITKERIRKLKRDIRKLIFKGEGSARFLARIAGQCISMCKCIFPAKLLLRNLYRLLSKRKSWSDNLQVDEYTLTDLKWWLESVSNWNALIVVEKKIDAQLITDASKSGWGAWLSDTHLEAQGFWNHRVANKSSNFRELFAVLMGMLSLREHLQNQNIQIMSDNITTVAMINGMGGSVPELDAIARAIYLEAIKANIHLQAKYISGKNNWKADLLSRVQSRYEWKLHPNLFQMLDRMWGPHQIDRFASITSTQLERYNSMYYDPMTFGVDALAQTDWGRMNNYVNPPFALIPKVLQVVCQQNAKATLIAPKWKAQPWYNQLVKMSIAPPIKLPISDKTVLAIGPTKEPLKNKKWEIYAWRISGRQNCEH